MSQTSKSTSVEIAINILYLWAILLAKLSIIALYLRVFSINRPFRHACYFLALAVTLYCFICTPLQLISCLPAGILSMNSLEAGRCIRVLPLNIAIGGLNIATDTILLLMPIPVLRTLQVSKSRLLVLSAVFATGLLSVPPPLPFYPLSPTFL